MLIVLERTDGAGKSTLMRAIRELHSDSFHILDKGPPDKRHILEQYERDLELLAGHAAHPDCLVICDRWHLGEMVYGPMLRGEARLNLAQFTHVEMFLEALGAVKVLVTANEAQLHQRHSDDPDPVVTWL